MCAGFSSLLRILGGSATVLGFPLLCSPSSSVFNRSTVPPLLFFLISPALVARLFFADGLRLLAHFFTSVFFASRVVGLVSCGLHIWPALVVFRPLWTFLFG